MSYTNGLDNPELFFQTKLYTGNGSTQSITLDGDTDMQPDYVMIKQRSSTQQWNGYDVIRGVQKYLGWNTSIQEYTQSAGLTAFGSNGFTVGGDDMVNGGSSTYVGYCWKAGTAFTNDASSTGIGTIDSTGSVNTDAGFSIVSWTGDGNNGATIAHGLGVTPAIVITKRRSAVGDWLVGGSAVDTVRGGANSLLLLNTTAAMDSNSEVYQTFSSTTFQVGVNAYANTSGSTMISYCFAEKQGYSKFGSYTGNGSTDGTFVYTGFKPAFVIAKESSEARDWQLWDNKRLGYNASGGNKNLIPNKTDVEDTYADIDILSNGFKLRSTSAAHNKVSQTYIYMAFAENPFVTSTSIPTTAR